MSVQYVKYLEVTAFCLDIAPSGDWLWYHLPVPALLLQKAHKGGFARRWTQTIQTFRLNYIL